METSESAQSLAPSSISSCSTVASTITMEDSSYMASFDSEGTATKSVQCEKNNNDEFANIPTSSLIKNSNADSSSNKTGGEAKFYIGDFDSNSNQLHTSSILIGNRLSLKETMSNNKHRSPEKHVRLAIHDHHYDHHFDYHPIQSYQPTTVDDGALHQHLTKLLLAESMQKILMSRNENNNNNRFITCDSDAAIINNLESDENQHQWMIKDSLSIPKIRFSDDESIMLNGNGDSISSEDDTFINNKDNDHICNTIVSFHSILIVVVQVLIAIVFSAGGNFGAGLILDNNQKWQVFNQVPELFYLVPTLLGLKGNLEMTMVARLSTMANMGKMNSWNKICWSALTNLATVQCQATLVSILASIVTFIIAFFAGTTTPFISFDHHAESIMWMESEGLNDTSSASSALVILDTTAHTSVKVLVIFATSLCTANVACLASSKFFKSF